MGSAGKTAFITILGLAAITGIIMYYLFDVYTIPKPGIINSVDRRNLTVTQSEKSSSATAGVATTGKTTSTSNANTPAGTTASTPTTPTTAAAAATLTIPVGAQTQGNPSYQPASLTVKKGDVIAVVNKDSAAHTVTNGKGPDDPNAGKQFDTSIISPGQSAKVDTASLAPGEYDFHCAVHPFMSGKLKVQ
jgi:plastocyanin